MLSKSDKKYYKYKWAYTLSAIGEGLFLASFIFLLLLIILEQLIPGFVTYTLSINMFIAATIIGGLLFTLKPTEDA